MRKAGRQECHPQRFSFWIFNSLNSISSQWENPDTSIPFHICKSNAFYTLGSDCRFSMVLRIVYSMFWCSFSVECTEFMHVLLSHAGIQYVTQTSKRAAPDLKRTYYYKVMIVEFLDKGNHSDNLFIIVAKGFLSLRGLMQPDPEH